MELAVVCALLASLSYAIFSKNYEFVIRRVNDNYGSAILLYFLSSIILILLSTITVFYYGRSPFAFSGSVFFGVDLSDFKISQLKQPILIFSICIMAILYSLHIVTEAVSRESINIGLYSIIFQISFVVVAISDILLNNIEVSKSNVMGYLLVLIASTFGLLVSSKVSKGSEVVRVNSKLLLIAIISSLTCGFALLMDGEIIRGYVFCDGLQSELIPTFLFYEAITFLFPTLLVYCYMRLKSEKKISDLISNFYLAPKRFFISSLFSASQFVFSVLSLSLPGSRLIPAIILGTSPFLCVLFDKRRETRVLLAELFLSLIIVIGVVLAVH